MKTNLHRVGIKAVSLVAAICATIAGFGAGGRPLLAAQEASAFEQLAALTAERVSKLHKRQILITTDQGCLLDRALCADSETLLRAELAKSLPNVQFISHRELVEQLLGHGLLAIDAYDGSLTRALAADAGAEIVVAQNLYWDGRTYKLANAVFKAGTQKRIVLLQTDVTLPNGGGDPLVFRDTQENVSLIVPKTKTSGFPVFRFPEFENCSLDGPVGPTWAPVTGTVNLRVTITREGAVTQIHDDPRSRLSKRDSDEATKVAQSCRFRPAIDSGGKPFAVRTFISIDYTARRFDLATPNPPWTGGP